MTVTIIIPTYNRCKLLQRALASVRAQTASDALEILVVDDGSTDDTRDLVAAQFPEVRYEFQSQKGPAAARNYGASLARGEWLAFLDSDDEWKPAKIETQIAFFAQNPDIRIAQTEEIWIRNGVRVNPMKKHQKAGGWIFEKCLSLCLISPSAVMMQHSLFRELGGFDESFPVCEDYELWLRVSARHQVGLIDSPLVIKYGGHEDQLSQALPAMDRFRIRALVKALRSGQLSQEQQFQARAMLTEKSRIFLQGAEKRGNHDEADQIRNMIHEWSDETGAMPS